MSFTESLCKSSFYEVTLARLGRTKEGMRADLGCVWGNKSITGRMSFVLGDAIINL